MKKISLILKNKKFAVLDKKYMETFFNKELGRFFPEFEKLTYLKIKDHSATGFKKAIQYSIAYQDKNKKIIKKSLRGNIPSLRSNHRAIIANQILKNLDKIGFNKDNFQANKPLDYFPKLRMMLYQSYPGIPLINLIIRKSPNIDKDIKNSAKWLIKFHNCQLKIGKLRTYQQEKQEATLFLKKFYEFFPDLVGDVKIILNKILKIKESLYPKIKNEAVLLHNDYNPHNIIVNGDKIGAIDFANACRFDPLFDVSNFLIQIEAIFCYGSVKDKSYLDRIRKIFLDQYIKESGGDKKQIIQRVNLYQSWWAIQIAYYLASIAVKKEKIAKMVTLAKKYLEKYEQANVY